MERIGLVGVGLLGSALAARLLAQGWQVVGYDLEPERLRELVQLGGQAASSAVDIGRQANQLILCLPDSRIVERVVADLSPVLVPGSLIVDTTTGAPEDAERQAAQLAHHQVDYAEATIAGSSAVVRDGKALTMIGSRDAIRQRVAAIADAWSARTIHVGACGAASRMKLTVNLVLGLHRAVLAEALSFAKALGLDPRQTLDVLMAGPAASAVMEAKGQKMVTSDFTPQARLSQHRKDVGLMRTAAQAAGAKTPLTDLHDHLLARAEQAGWGALDNSAVIRVYE